MERRSFETPLGEVWLWGSAEAFDGDGPLVFVISGLMAKRDDLHWLADGHRQFIFAHPPGFYSPTLAAQSFGAFAGAFDHVVRATLGDRGVYLVGSSAGATIAATMRDPNIRGRVLIEPFFSTGGLWPLHELILAQRSTNTSLRRWAGAVLGTRPDQPEDRSVALPTRLANTIALAGDEPLHPRRPLWRLPSLTSPEDRAALRSAGVTVRTVPGGHDVPTNDPAAVRHALLDVYEPDEQSAIGSG